MPKAGSNGAIAAVKSGLTSGQTLAKIAAHATAGGTLTVLQGGKFGHGFVSAGFTEALSPAVGQMGEGRDFGTVLAKTAASAAIGGTASALSGGSFANGAQTGAFQHLFNHVATGRQEAATRSIEIMYSNEDEGFEAFVLRLGARVNELTQRENVEFTAAIGARADFNNGQDSDRFGAVIVTQDAATWSAASRIPKGFSKVLFNGKGLTIHAHPENGRITRNDKLFLGGDGANIRIGGRAPGSHQISNVDQATGALFLATPRGVLFYNGRSTNAFPPPR